MVLLIVAGAGDGQAIRCDDSQQRQHHDSGVERPSIQTATQACLQPERHHQRDPIRFCSTCAGDHNEIQTANFEIFTPDANATDITFRSLLMFVVWCT
jgi:hypothetical protein